MISYKPFWETLKKKNTTTYALIKNGISSATINRLRHNQGISTQTVDDLCQLLHCRVEDVLEISLDGKD
jgi:putative transcriptional regulator